MPSIAPGDIVFAPFPYEGDQERSKLRPCLVLANASDSSRFLAAKLTTTPLERWWAVPLRAGIEDVTKGSILKASWVNLNRREWIAKADCVRWLASLKPDIFKMILDKISTPN